MTGIEGIVLDHDEQKSHCTLYVLRSCSDDPVIKKNREKVLKFVITNGDIGVITKNASHEPDWLLAQVEQVAAYRFKDVSASQLHGGLFETLIPQAHDISITDGDGQTVKPIGWYATSIADIEDAVEIMKWN